MSGYHGRGRYNRRRSRSPRRDSRDFQRGASNTRRRDGGSRDDFRGSFGDRGGREENERSRTTASALPPLPASVPFPEGTGREIPYIEHITRGTIGRKVLVFANHHAICTLPVIKIYQYDVRFKVPASSQARGSEKVTASQMARVLINTTLADFLGEHFIFDGVSLGFSPGQLMPVGESRFTTISLGKRRDDKPNEVEIGVRNVGTLEIGRLVAYLIEGRLELNPAGNPSLESMFKWLNALFRDEPARRMVTRPNSNAFFQRSRETSMTLPSTGGVLEALRGIFQAVQLRFSRLSVCVDTSTSPFWTPDLSLIDCVCALVGERPPQNLQQRFVSNLGLVFQACGMLLGCYFNVRHLNGVRNAKKMKFLSWSGQDAFSTVFDEDIKLLYPKLPLAHTRDGDFPLELSFTAPGERYRGVLQGPATADFIKFATASAFIRRQQIAANLRHLAWHENTTLRAHGVSVNPSMMQVNAAVLEAPKIVYGERKIAHPKDGKWNIQGLQFLRPSTIKSWALISFTPEVDRLDTLGRQIMGSFRAVGMSVPREPPSIIIGNAQGDVLRIIDNALAKAQQEFGSPPDLILIVLNAGVSLYRAMKHALDTIHGIFSQAVTERGLRDRGFLQYWANITLKSNVKLGGLNSTVHQALFKQSRWMLIGGDTSSASPSALKRDPPPPTTAAYCATYDQDCTAYTSIASMQQSTETNTIVHAGAMFKELLIRYKEKNNGLMPERIIYYRDGASESELEAIRDNEGLELRRLCQASGTKITIIVAIKRHHSRFFAEGQLATQHGNVPPGTIIENSSSRNDAYIVAHRILAGTARPTRYLSIVDENNLSADVFHRLTYELCSTYARATTSVAVVPPIYYAHQICERARLHLQDKPDGSQYLPQVHDNLKWKMYWQ